MPYLKEKSYGEICGLLSAASGLLGLLVKSDLTDKQTVQVSQINQALNKIRQLLNGQIKTRAERLRDEYGDKSISGGSLGESLTGRPDSPPQGE